MNKRKNIKGNYCALYAKKKKKKKKKIPIITVNISSNSIF